MYSILFSSHFSKDFVEVFAFLQEIAEVKASRLWFGGDGKFMHRALSKDENAVIGNEN